MSDSQFYGRIFLLLILAIIGFLTFQIIAPFLAPIAWAAIFAFILYPLHKRLTPKLGGRPGLSATILLITGIIFMMGPLVALGSTFVAQAAILLGDIQAQTQSGRGLFTTPLREYALIGGLIEWGEATLNLNADDMLRWLSDGLRRALQSLVGLSGKLFLGAVNTAVASTIMAFILFFFIRDGETIIKGLKALSPLSRKRADELFTYVGEAMNAVIFGTVLTALVQGALVGLAFAVLGLPAPVVFGAVTALFALLPVGGPSITWVPAALFLLSDDRWLAALGLTAWGLLMVATIDNILRPILVSSRAQVGILTVFIGVIGGAAAFGLIGLLIGPVIMALVMAIIDYMIAERLGSMD